ncbi:MAG: GNAT family N-acetyltransferase [Paludibacteraceae bacterium]|nr:GNAT family N-acetyltransferase [Paludibacteraceae bacterium]
MTPKEQYAAFCKRYPGLPVMLQPWWLEAVCAGKEWEVMLVTQSELKNEHGSSRNDTDSCPTDEVVATMPYLLRKRLWYKFIVMPQMTMFGGVWMNDDLFASPELQERLAKVIARKLRALGVAYYYQQYPIGNPMPYWFGKQRMKVEDRVTYRIDNLTDIESAEEAFSQNKKRQLKKAEGLTIDYDMTAEEFYRFHRACMRERGQHLSYSREFLLVLEKKCRRENHGTFIRVCEGDQTAAAAFVVWDRRYLYYLIPAYLPSAAKSGASARLADEAIRMAKEKNLQFDFEGGNDSEGIANHYKQFGSHAVTYQSVSRLYRPSFALLLAANRWKEKLMKIRG